MQELTDFELGAIVVSIGLFLVYHFYFYFYVLLSCKSSLTEKHQRVTQLSMNIRNAVHWLQKHFEKSDAPTVTLAIQTFRNTILVATFIGGYALQYGFSYSDSYFNLETRREQVRAAVIAICLFFSFLCWAVVIRCISHLGYLVGTLSHPLAQKAFYKKTNITNPDSPIDQSLSPPGASSPNELEPTKAEPTNDRNHSIEVLNEIDHQLLLNPLFKECTKLLVISLISFR